MKERPILFSGSMVRAILEGGKTQTRRAVKPGLHVVCENPDQVVDHSSPHFGRALEQFVHCPYGQPGDRLWVKETFYCDHFFAGDHEKSCSGCVRCKHTDEDRIRDWQKELYYRADVPGGRFEDAGYWGEPGSAWKPSIHMWRWASRITLDVTGVRVERLRDISEEDCLAEGVTATPPDKVAPYGLYRELWNSINGADSFDLNPWVWVVEFKRVEAKSEAA